MSCWCDLACVWERALFKIDKRANRIIPLEETRFADLKMKERQHLQEWIAHHPAALGEDLLIIQKEFAGFDDTKERLDLLALDKDGRLVLIENKLDDTGRDVVWQSIKYAAYASSLQKAQIAEIFQKYLDQRGGGNAIELICEFLDVDGLEDVSINSVKTQRIILIAANFRKEVTATALWLLGHEISVQCFTVKPFLYGEDAFLDIRQIIPVPEAAEYMIGIARKENEDRVVQETQKHAHNKRVAFWTKALERLNASGSGTAAFNGIGPGRDHWLSATCGLSGCRYSLIFEKNEARVEINFERQKIAENKKVLDLFFEQKEAFQQAFGDKVIWNRGLDDRKASRIQYGQEFDCYNEENWPTVIDWLATHIVKLEKACAAPLAQAAVALKQASSS